MVCLTFLIPFTLWFLSLVLSPAHSFFFLHRFFVCALSSLSKLFLQQTSSRWAFIQSSGVEWGVGGFSLVNTPVRGCFTVKGQKHRRVYTLCTATQDGEWSVINDKQLIQSESLGFLFCFFGHACWAFTVWVTHLGLLPHFAATTFKSHKRRMLRKL